MMGERTFGRYLLQQQLGAGGMGEVWIAQDTKTDRKVALKLLAKDAVGDGESRERFMREARFATRVRDPHIVPIHDFGEIDGQLYIDMELLEGEDLAHTIRRAGWLAPARAVDTIAQVAAALDAIHAAGLTHRDVKPSNLFVSTPYGFIYLIDFGIARDTFESGLTSTGMAVGTYAYMAPERFTAGEYGARADIYSLACVLYECLTGARAFEARDIPRLISAHLSAPRPRASAVNPSVPAALDEVLVRAMAKDPADRFASAGEFARAAAECLVPTVHSTPTDVTVVGPSGRSMPTVDSLPEPPAAPPPTKKFRTAHDRVITPEPALDLRTNWVGRELDDRYRLLERMVRGRSGDLYKAYDSMRARLVAVKLVETSSSETHERLERAGRIWLNLSHPNVTRVLEVRKGIDGNPPYIVSEIIDGIDLGRLSAERDIESDSAIRIVMLVCEALEYIHGCGIVHREITPSNIVVSGTGREIAVTLLDSGIARHVNPEVDAFTKTGVFVGDLSYAAPEQLAGRKVGKRTDVYSLAAVLYELITGATVPFPVPAQWDPGEDLDFDVPPRLRNALVHGLNPDPKQRFASAVELRDALKPLIQHALPAERRVVIALHGIRTRAVWQRSFSEIAGRHGMSAHVDRWNFGYFSIFRLVTPWSRLAKVRWFRQAYQMEFGEITEPGGRLPSVVAHSFGSYILGYALLRYPYLRFDKVLLCGSILPPDFPWAQLIDRGQVQAVRNEYGSQDPWTRMVGWFVEDAGPAGMRGFDDAHPRLEQERFSFAHSEYFERGHMTSRWVPFLNAEVAERPAQETPVLFRTADQPWAFYLGGLVLIVMLVAIVLALGS